MRTSRHIRSRIAPTPSGFLHMGNGVNFVLTWLFCRQQEGCLKLRIDDADSSRARPEFIEDIFRQLEWLGLDWDEGPDSPDDFQQNHSQQHRIDRYHEALKILASRSFLFPCSCTRSMLKKQGGGGLYPGTCRRHAGAIIPGRALRIHVPEETFIDVEGRPVALCKSMGDFILWRRDNLPSYQLVSLIDDLDDRITLIVRGADLLESTAAQRFLARELGEDAFSKVDIRHHSLLASADGSKLSKSDKALSLYALRQAGMGPSAVYEAVADLLGLPTQATHTLEELAAAFHQKIGLYAEPISKTPLLNENLAADQNR